MSILRNINYLIKLSAIPCAQPDILILAKTAFQAAPPALLELFQPDCTDIIKASLGLSPFGEARTIKGLLQGATRTGPGRGKHGRRIRGAIRNIARPLAYSPTEFLYKIKYFQIEKYLRYFQIADVTTSFLANWQSLIYQAQQCQLPGAGSANAIFSPFIGGPESIGIMDVSPINSVFGLTWLVNAVQVAPGFDATVAWSMEWRSWPDQDIPCDANTWYTVNEDPAPRGFMGTNDPARRNGQNTGGSFYHGYPDNVVTTTYRFWHENNGTTPMLPINSQLSIGLSGKDMGFRPFGCNLKPVSWPFPSL